MRSVIRQKLCIVIVDRLLIGLVLVGVGFLATLYIERTKAKLSFNDSIARMRVDKIAEVWTELVELEQSLHEQRRAIEAEARKVDAMETEERRKYDFRQGIQKEVDERMERLSAQVATKGKTEQLSTVDMTLERNRFWLGEDVYKRCRQFLNEVRDGGIVKDDAAALLRLDELRLDVQRLLDML